MNKSKIIFKIIGVTLVLLSAGQVFAHGMSEADQQAMIDGGYLQYMWLGASHMLTGYDHLLFVFGIVFFLTTFKDIVKYITAFTVVNESALVAVAQALEAHQIEGELGPGEAERVAYNAARYAPLRRLRRS